MRYLITGGAGFIGCELTRALLLDSQNEIVLADNLHRAKWPQWKGVEMLRIDIRDRDELAKAVSGVDIVYHLAAQSNVMGAIADLDYSFTTNVQGTFNVLSESLRAGVKRLVFASSREVYGEVTSLPVSEDTPLRPKNAYGASKVAGEEYCRVMAREGLPVTILRFANVYGPNDHGRVIPLFVGRARRGEALQLFGGDQVIDFISIGRVVKALLFARDLDKQCGPVNIGSGFGTTVRELAERILELIPSPSGIQTLEARGVEVGAFIADIRRGVELGLIEAGIPPLQELKNTIAMHQRLENMSPASYSLATSGSTESESPGVPFI